MHTTALLVSKYRNEVDMHNRKFVNMKRNPSKTKIRKHSCMVYGLLICKSKIKNSAKKYWQPNYRIIYYLSLIQFFLFLDFLQIYIYIYARDWESSASLSFGVGFFIGSMVRPCKIKRNIL